MKVVQINSVCGIGSTGRICVEISKLLTEAKIENYILYTAESSGYPLGIRCGSRNGQKLQALKSRVLGNYGFNSHRATKTMIRHLERIRPDIVHLHNIHGHDCDLQMLFTWFRQNNTKLFWTFHDCWAFTGYCTHFTLAGCSQWKHGCTACPQRTQYSWFFDRSAALYRNKQALFSGLDLTILTPSHWLKGLVKQSFLKDYPVHVLPNGIDLSVFHPTDGDIRRRYHIPGHVHIILGVSYGWSVGKGLDVFVELAHRLNPDQCKIVLVGTDEQTEKQLPSSILAIRRTNNQQELAELYTAADVFVNPTREDNFPTVNLEALACGTPVITFRTGGSPEMLDSSCGSVVDCNDVDALEREIVRICKKKPFTPSACTQRAAEFDKNKKLYAYTQVYCEGSHD